MEWYELHKDELLQDWNSIRTTGDFFKIAPLGYNSKKQLVKTFVTIVFIEVSESLLKLVSINSFLWLNSRKNAVGVATVQR